MRRSYTIPYEVVLLGSLLGSAFLVRWIIEQKVRMAAAQLARMP